MERIGPAWDPKRGGRRMRTLGWEAGPRGAVGGVSSGRWAGPAAGNH